MGKIEVRGKERYFQEYRKDPRGFGVWFFKIGSQRPDEFYGMGLYGEIKAAAIKHTRLNHPDATYIEIMI